MTRRIELGRAAVGGGAPLLVIAGPCVMESDDVTALAARRMKEICEALGLPFVFKSSYDKANRTSASSFRGPGLERGLRTLADIRSSLGVPVTSDVHSVSEVGPASGVLDLIQIPALLSRQTDLIAAAARTGRPVNVKKGQFLAPWDVRNVIEKCRSEGNRDVMVSERGTTFGYNNLVVDMRAIPIMRSLGVPVVFDVTHSLQLPGGKGVASGGQREFAGPLMRAAVAAGADGIFMEVHPEPDKALCDGPNMIPLDEVEEMLSTAKRVYEASGPGGGGQKA